MPTEPTLSLAGPKNLPAGSTRSVSATTEEVTAGLEGRSLAGFEDVPQQIARFLIRKRIGGGGFGSVYLAYDPVLDREIALKVPRANGNWGDEQTQSFLSEARIAVRLKHPNVVAVHDAGENAESGVFIAMEYVDGESLSERLKRGKLSVQDAVRICGQIAEAIQVGHKLGLIHRDLKPANILLDTKGNVKVCDFGLAMHEEGQQARRGEVSGTLPYMSPEQVDGNSHLLDGRSDIWSLGVILYECLSGRRPFRGDTWEETSEQIRTRDPKPLRQLDEAIPPALDELCQHCLRRNLPDRLSTALDFQRRLAQATRQESEKWVRRSLAVGAIVLVCAAVGLAASGWTPWGAAGVVDQNNREGTTPDTKPALTVPSPENLAPGIIDLLATKPREVVFEKLDSKNFYSYTENPGKLAIHSIDWSAFACGKQPLEFQMKVAALPTGETAQVGVFWGLHAETSAEGLAQEACLSAVLQPDSLDPAKTYLHIFRLLIADNAQGHRHFFHTFNLSKTPVEVDWKKTVEIELLVKEGKCEGVSIQGKSLKTEWGGINVEWNEFSAGECGLISTYSKDQVVFSRALLQTPVRKTP
ncbi:MAG: serine/threonine-protein kinase [Pirellulaceae bacterium]